MSLMVASVGTQVPTRSNGLGFVRVKDNSDHSMPLLMQPDNSSANPEHVKKALSLAEKNVDPLHGITLVALPFTLISISPVTPPVPLYRVWTAVANGKLPSVPGATKL